MADSAFLGLWGADGFYRYTSDEVAIRSQSRDICTPIHELTHKISGGTFVSGRGKDAECERSRMGFAKISHEENLKQKLDEALTQHITCGIVFGDFDTLDPDERQDEDDNYYEYRKVIAAFVDRSGGLLDARTVIHAYFEDSGPRGSTAARRKFIHQANLAYGSGALTRLETLLGITALVDEDDFDDMFEDIILKNVIPPRLDVHGNVVEPGCIDLKKIFPLAEDGYGRIREVFEQL